MPLGRLLAVVAGTVVVAGLVVLQPWSPWTRRTRASDATAVESPPVKPPVVLVDANNETISIEPELIGSMGLTFGVVSPAPATRPLRMNGQLALDPGRLVHVQSRFPGEVVSVHPDPAIGRVPQVGDRVKKGQILAEIWSKEVGEKKSDLVDAISNLFLHESILDKLRKLQDGAVPLRTVEEMRRTYEADLITVTRLRRTLRSWRISEEELREIDAEARRLHEAALHPREPSQGVPEVADPARELRWAEIDVIAPTDGIILEKNMTVGDTIDPSFDLFKIADLSRMRVMAYVFEEDLPRLLSLPMDLRTWQVEWHTGQTDGEVAAEIDVIGHVVDPNQHTAVVSGWIENPKQSLRVGQFISATVEIPAEKNAVVVPTSAIIDQGTRAYVLVADNVEGTRLSRRKVKVLRRSGDLVWLTRESGGAGESGRVKALEPGERIVTSGTVELHSRLVQLLNQATSTQANE